MPRVIHFEILAEDPDKLTEFYRDVLGWNIQTWDSPQAYWLVSTGPSEEPGINGGIMGRHFPQAVINTIQVEALEPMLERVQAAGGRLAFGPHEIPNIGRHAYCQDPQGNWFGLLQPVGQPG